MVNTQFDPMLDHVGAWPIKSKLITKGMFEMGLLLILFENKIIDLELPKLDLLIKYSFKMFLIYLMILDCIDTSLIKQSKLVQPSLMRLLIGDEILE